MRANMLTWIMAKSQKCLNRKSFFNNVRDVPHGEIEIIDDQRIAHEEYSVALHIILRFPLYTRLCVLLAHKKRMQVTLFCRFVVPHLVTKCIYGINFMNISVFTVADDKYFMACHSNYFYILSLTWDCQIFWDIQKHWETDWKRKGRRNTKNGRYFCAQMPISCKWSRVALEMCSRIIHNNVVMSASAFVIR